MSGKPPRISPGRPPVIDEQSPSGFLVQHLAKTWRSVLGRRLRPHDLSASAFGVLCLLAESEVGFVQRDLAERLDVEGSTLVRLLDQLERRGLVRRVPAAQDRRRKVVRITARGLVLLHGLGNVLFDLDAEVLDGISTADQAVLIELLVRLIRRVEAL